MLGGVGNFVGGVARQREQGKDNLDKFKTERPLNLFCGRKQGIMVQSVVPLLIKLDYSLHHSTRLSREPKKTRGEKGATLPSRVRGRPNQHGSSPSFTSPLTYIVLHHPPLLSLSCEGCDVHPASTTNDPEQSITLRSAGTHSTSPKSPTLRPSLYTSWYY